jgi:hypothetical protein
MIKFVICTLELFIYIMNIIHWSEWIIRTMKLFNPLCIRFYFIPIPLLIFVVINIKPFILICSHNLKIFQSPKLNIILEEKYLNLLINLFDLEIVY